MGLERWEKQFLWKHEELSLHSKHPCKKLFIVTWTWNHSAGRAETGSSLDFTGLPT